MNKDIREKTIKEGKWELHYTRYLDYMGFERDAFDLFDTEKRIHRPFIGGSKVNNHDRTSDISKLGYEWTDGELREILLQEIEKVSS